MVSPNYEQKCPMMRFVAIFSGKWAIPIVYHLIAAEHAVRFSTLAKALAPIAQKELSKQLKLLEQHHLVQKKIYAEVPPRVEYQITALGKTLEQPLTSLAQWMLNFEQQNQSDDASSVLK